MTAERPTGLVGPDVLSPLNWLRRSALVHAARPAVVEDATTVSFAELEDRVLSAAGLLRTCGVGPGDRVAVLAKNSLVALESQFAVPAAGATLVALNHRLHVDELAHLLDHARVRVLILHHDLAELGERAVGAARTTPRIVPAGGPDDEYHRGLARTPAHFHPVTDERTPYAINYTSGSTGPPKGVVVTHRNIALQGLAMMVHLQLGADSRYLWTLPMFHANGWCLPGALLGAGATQYCIPDPTAPRVWQELTRQAITHLSAAPTVLSNIAHHPDAAPLEQPVLVSTGGAPPPPSIIRSMGELGFEITHLYGLTESSGPAVFCDIPRELRPDDTEELARLTARQGVANVVTNGVVVVDEAGVEVPADATTMGEVLVAGTTIFQGYLDDEEATRESLWDGWLRTGDMGVVHPDGYVEIRDRAKDIIISGGENISSVEIEQILASHPRVLEAAVVAAPDEYWGEVPAAFVTLDGTGEVTREELVAFVKARAAGFKAPRRVTFGELPKSGTGKIQKDVLRSLLTSDAQEGQED